MDIDPLIEFGGLSRPPEELSSAETQWVGYQPYLLSRGYQLRPRYQPDWVPSWTTSHRDPVLCEDAWDAMPYRVLDAFHIEQQRWVMIKMIVPSAKSQEGLQELAILQRFSSDDLMEDPTNHVIQCLDTFPIPDIEGGVFYVMPLLTHYNSPPFGSLEEVQDLLYQLFEGLEFLHRHHVAHCDIAGANIMMNGRVLYDEQFHPLNHEFSLDGTRILQIHPRYRRSIRYYYIDFGYSVWNKERSPKFRIKGSEAREPAPEQVHGDLYDPFSADVYQLGAVIRRDLIPQIRSLRFLLPLARAMTEESPEKRISLAQAHQSLHKVFATQGAIRMRWPIIPKGVSITQWIAYTAIGVRNEISHLFNMLVRLYHSIRGTAPASGTRGMP